MKYGIIITVITIVLLLIYFVLEKGTQITYDNVSEADAIEFEQISKLVEGRSCDGAPISLEYAKKLNEEMPQFDFAVKQGGLIVNGHYFKCTKEKGNLILKFVDPNRSP
jgi:hypothetical protein